MGTRLSAVIGSIIQFIIQLIQFIQFIFQFIQYIQLFGRLKGTWERGRGVRGRRVGERGRRVEGEGVKGGGGRYVIEANDAIGLDWMRLNLGSAVGLDRPS